MKITHPLTTALAAAALVIPVAGAQAKPVDMHASTAIAAAQAREQAQTRQALRSPPPEKAPVPVAQPSDGGTDWTTVLIGIAASLIAVGGIALVMSRRHTTPR